MHRIVLALVLLSTVPTAALAARTGNGPGGGPAPRVLLGTWQTTLTQADVEKLNSFETHHAWKLIIANKPYLSYPRALGLQPGGAKGDTVPFAVSGKKLLISCLDDNGIATAGHGTYSWTIRAGQLHLSLVKEPCSNRILRDRIIILTSHPWHRTG